MSVVSRKTNASQEQTAEQRAKEQSTSPAGIAVTTGRDEGVDARGSPDKLDTLQQLSSYSLRNCRGHET